MVNNGHGTIFWQSKWLGNQALMDAFPEAYDADFNRVGNVADFRTWNDNQFSHCNGAEDVHTWMLSGDGRFTVRSFYELFFPEFAVGDSINEDVARALVSLWKLEAPPKLQFFGWRVLLNCIATKDQLFMRNIVPVSNDLCCVFCTTQLEDTDHLFGSCLFTDYIWRRVMNWLYFFEEMYFEEFKNYFFNVEKVKNALRRKVVAVIWLVAIWSVWLLKNDSIF
ncbi:uncharacterized protein LOC131650065 [Vicia villosa]|uniref:uncharacterized protein LOC131650065 n=1 Tax=Vicia villosa TaxID=3911 RepID=UPI00273AC17C|nr:uncharacterized protein LOC131650065 [Vicia villosa]